MNFGQSISKLTLQMENANLPKDICEVEKLKMTQIGTQYQIIGHDFYKTPISCKSQSDLEKAMTEVEYICNVVYGHNVILLTAIPSIHN